MPSSGGGNNDDGDSGDSNNNRNNGGGGDGGDGSESNGDYRGEALFVLTQVGRKLGSLPADLSASVEGGRVTGEIVRRFCRDGGVAAAPLAAAVLLSFLSDTTRVMTIVADFMLVYLPAPTVSLQPPLATSAGLIANFFHNCPDNAFQIAMAGRSYSLLQRLGAILRNGAKLFAVGTSASLVGTGVTNALIKARKAVDKELDDEVEDIPVVSTSVAYGVYMAVSSNLRYQVLSGVIEQRMLEPVLHNHKLLLSALCFAVRTGNTFLGSLLWVDYARMVGVQKVQEEI